MVSTREITAAEAHPLRRAVLRDGDPDSNVAFPQDTDPAAFHLAIERNGAIIAVASFSPAETPYRAGVAAWQLRGMAVAFEHQGAGHGGTLIAAAADRIRATGAHVLWCNARDSAAGFYDGLGFIVHGEGFLTTETKLPHHVMLLDL